jgi:hypothetical protein
MGTYWGLFATAVALVGLVITYRNLLGDRIHLYVLDVSGVGSPVNSTLVKFATPLIGSGLRFNWSAAVGNWESRAVTRDSAGKVYVSGTSEILASTDEILASTNPGQRFSSAIDGSAAGLVFPFPAALALDANDNLYVADEGRLGPNGIPSRVIIFWKGAPPNTRVFFASADDQPSYFTVATGVAVDRQSNVYVVSGSDPTTNRFGYPQVVVIPSSHDVSRIAIVGPMQDDQHRPTLPGWPRRTARRPPVRHGIPDSPSYSGAANVTFQFRPSGGAAPFRSQCSSPSCAP